MKKTFLLFTLLLLLGSLQTLSAERYHVKVDGDDWADGRSWKQAFATLQKALNQAKLDDEIWVAAGVYTPTESAMEGYDGDTRRSNSFMLTEGVKLYGGFPAEGNPGMAQRNWETHITTLSGNIGDPRQEIDNVYHVVMALNLVAKTLMDGFVISGGRADDIEATVSAKGSSFKHGFGGGIFCHKASLVLQNIIFQHNYAIYGGAMLNDQSESSLYRVTFKENTADKNGGGMNSMKSTPSLKEVVFYRNVAAWGGGLMIDDEASPSLQDVVFEGNAAVSGGGGGLYISTGSCPRLEGLTFKYNSADQGGGGLFNGEQTKPVLYKVSFLENSAAWGGAILNYNTAAPLLNQVIISGNSATKNGGGISNYAEARPLLCNVLISGNNAPEGGGIYNKGCTPLLFHVTLAANYAESGSAMLNNEAAPELHNCLIIDNYSGVLNTASIPQYNHSMVQGMTAYQLNNTGGEGNVDAADAKLVFVDPAGPASTASVRGNYHLAKGSPVAGKGSSKLWEQRLPRFDGKSLTDYLASLGLPMEDLDGKPRKAEATDLGAYVVAATK